ncbi:LicD family protein [Solibacillus sp.]|uniref:LicD family protein n=1 Tax=Solibacillus sp. TaxID=1909654 RepID=UPI00331523EF
MENTLVTQKLTRKVQLKCLEALIEIKKICEKHNLQYYLIGGTALGAYRHKGFIPWDDDIDIGMPRIDYEKFLQVAQQELGDNYYLQTPKTEFNFVFPFTKIRINNTLYKESSIKHLNIHHGVFVDIFPLDTVPENKLSANTQKNLIKFCNRIRAAKISHQRKIHFKNIIKSFLKLYPSSLLRKQYNYALLMGAKSQSRKMGNLLSAYPYGTEIMDKSIFAKGKKIEFEGINFSVPNQIEKFLIKMYGEDYMQLPPLEKRITHLPSEIAGI